MSKSGFESEMPSVQGKPTKLEQPLHRPSGATSKIGPREFNAFEPSRYIYSNDVLIASSGLTDVSKNRSETPENVEVGYPDERSNISYRACSVDFRIMKAQWLFDDRSGVIQSTNGSHTSTSTSSAAQFTSENKKRKRQNRHGGRSGENDEDDIADNNDDNGNNRRNLDSGKRPRGSKKRFACPFFKRDPEKHMGRRSCTGPGYSGIHQLKEHLYRNHEVRPCPICYADMKTDEALELHVRSQVCERREAPPCEGINRPIKSRLENRKGWSKKSDIEKWEPIYRILFPNDEALAMPSPFYEDDELPLPGLLSAFEEYCRRELPRSVRMELDSKSRRGDDINSEIETLVRHCYDGIVTTFKGSGRSKTAQAVSTLAEPETCVLSQSDESTSVGSSTHDALENILGQVSYVTPDLTFDGFNTSGLEPSTQSFDYGTKTSQEGSDQPDYFGETFDFMRILDFPFDPHP
ncbi:hypothetical protein BU16DRAFT_541350 [Lophium mytilinum]|uniref:C2H2-type domain-containing protein n=1 Tax=Lophium mytilinum TaxID=390894 RepID=A0A6A6QKN4_9PEZI|nr:hypothetical protein BU16DRAFT_541350 [Lophium mytilinum]